MTHIIHTSFADDFPICQGTFQDLFVFRVDLLIGQGPRHVAPGDAEHLWGAACGQDLGATGESFCWREKLDETGILPKIMGWNWDLAKNYEMKLGFGQKLWDETGILPKNGMKLGFWKKQCDEIGILAMKNWTGHGKDWKLWWCFPTTPSITATTGILGIKITLPIHNWKKKLKKMMGNTHRVSHDLDTNWNAHPSTIIPPSTKSTLAFVVGQFFPTMKHG